ncbi:MAG: hypothetical protein UHN02_03580 [Acutalibacteraceae bacterium]|nr:hypothetical protein [Acutalibacteraceae bacterium]
MKTELLKKFTSRKFLAALVGFVTPLLIAFNVPDSTVSDIASIIMSCGTLIAYIIGESIVDSKK